MAVSVAEAADARQQSRGLAQIALGVVGVVRSHCRLSLAQNGLQLRAVGSGAVDTVRAGREFAGEAQSLLGVEQRRVPFGEEAQSAAGDVSAGVAGGVVEGDQALQHSAIGADALGRQFSRFAANDTEGLNQNLDLFHRRRQVEPVVAVGDEAFMQSFKMTRDERDAVDGRGQFGVRAGARVQASEQSRGGFAHLAEPLAVYFGEVAALDGEVFTVGSGIENDAEQAGVDGRDGIALLLGRIELSGGVDPDESDIEFAMSAGLIGLLCQFRCGLGCRWLSSSHNLPIDSLLSA